MADHEDDCSENESNWHEACDCFDDMKLQDQLLRGVYAYGFEKPSEIQRRGIPAMLTGKDCICQAQSGTGKTGAFCIALLQRLDLDNSETQAIILSPTRELAMQNFTVLRALGDHLGVKAHTCVGGTSVQVDRQALRAGVQVVVGTPGRVFDLINRQTLRTDSVHMLVLDEADEMLSKGFQEQIQEIMTKLPGRTQIGLFSATMPQDILDLTRQFMRTPHRVLVKKEALTLEGIKQFYVAVENEDWKFGILCDLYQTLNISQAIIYCNTKRKATQLASKMNAADFTVSCLHSEMPHEERSEVMSHFRRGSTRVLITTDLLARGIDIQQVSLVINYDLPGNRENYIHRIGRGGRFGRKGVAINFMAPADEPILRELQSFYNTSIPELPNNIQDLL